MVLSALFIIFADVMRIDIITVLPEMLEGFFNESILARAQKKGLAEIHLHNLRDYTLDKWKRVDDYPYGGSAGMVMPVSYTHLYWLRFRYFWWTYCIYGEGSYRSHWTIQDEMGGSGSNVCATYIE